MKRFKLRSGNLPKFKSMGSSPLKKTPYYRVNDDGSRTEIDFETFKKEANQLKHVYATGQERVDLWKKSLTGKTGIDEVDATPRGSKQEEYKKALKSNKKKSPVKQVDWNTAPGVGTQERTQWYIDNNLKLDDTTPELKSSETTEVDDTAVEETTTDTDTTLEDKKEDDTKVKPKAKDKESIDKANREGDLVEAEKIRELGINAYTLLRESQRKY